MSLWGWFKSIFVTPEIDTVELYHQDEDTAEYMFEHDLSYWNYLGQTGIHYTDKDGKPGSSTKIAFFVSKDEDERSYIILGDEGKVKYFSTHNWIYTVAEPWLHGEYDLYVVIRDTPSKFLRQYMKDRYSVVWSNISNGWVKSEQTAYDNVVRQQQSKKETTTENANIIKLDFNR